MNKEIDLERKKNTRLGKDNINLKKELDSLKSKTSGDNSPDLLKQKIIDLNAKIATHKKDNSNKSKEISCLVSRIEKSQYDFAQVSEYMTSEIQSLSTWIGSCLNSKYVFSMIIKEKDEYALPKCIDFPKIMETKPEVFDTKSKSMKISGLPKQIEALKKLLRKSQVDLIDVASKISNDNDSLKEDVNETHKLKQEISQHFNKLNESMISTENSINSLTSEKAGLQLELSETKQKCIDQISQFNEIKLEYDRFLWDVLFSLETAKSKYENSEHFKHKIADLDSQLLLKIKQELETPESDKLLNRSDKKTGIIKYTGLLSEMINVLMSESKVSKVQQESVARLEKQIDVLKIDFKNQQEHYELEKAEIINDKNIEGDLKAQEINDLCNNYQNQILVIRGELENQQEECKAKDERVNILNADLAVLTNNVQNQTNTLVEVKEMCDSAVTRANDLIFQKKIILKQFSTLKESYSKTCLFIERVYYKIRELNLDSSFDDMQQEHSNNTEMNNSSGYHPLLKLRKCVLAVIAMNRMKFLSHSDNGFGKHNLEDIENIEIIENFSQVNEHIFVHGGYNNPYCDTEDQMKSFSKVQNSIDASISVTPIKAEGQDSIARHLFMKQGSNSKSCGSMYKLKSSNSKYKRRHRDLDLFPYINLNSILVKKLSAKARASQN